MNLRALKLFVTIVEAGGLARASTRLHLSQPAASRQLLALESDLGVQLFYRSARRLMLTPEGADLLAHSRQLLKTADLLVERAASLRGGTTGTFRVAATTHVIASVLAPFIGDHMKRHPGVEVRLVEGGAAQQPQRLESGEVQLAIMPSGDARFESRLLYPVFALAVLPRSHRLARRSELDVEDLAEEPMLLLQREFGSRIWFERACEIARFRPIIRLESAAPQTLVELASVGYGVAVLPSTVRIQVTGLRVMPLLQNGVPLGRWSTVAWDRNRRLPEYARRFVDELIERTRTDQPGKTFTSRAPTMAMPTYPVT